ncbi:MAG: YjjG family noncanonical pyrimidine nucleotidase [Clostridia bacterium]|nr:YjjG family noncanonical pyrimidine nucleotidase [Clostridia bacterium]
MIKVILWDVDGTLLDFPKAEYEAIKTCFRIFDLGECTDEMVARYSEINKKYWEMLERKELTKPEVLVGRFREFFAKEKIQTDCAEDFNKEYQLRLGDTICFCDNSYELLKSLKGRVKQYAVTNGTRIAQDKKLNRSGLIDVFDGIFISEDIGIEKPDVGFFQSVFERIGQYEKDEVMIVGDSLTSDMQGGNNAGILCCWYNPKHVPLTKALRIDYEIDDLNRIEDILIAAKACYGKDD